MTRVSCAKGVTHCIKCMKRFLWAQGRGSLKKGREDTGSGCERKGNGLPGPHVQVPALGHQGCFARQCFCAPEALSHWVWPPAPAPRPIAMATASFPVQTPLASPGAAVRAGAGPAAKAGTHLRRHRKTWFLRDASGATTNTSECSPGVWLASFIAAYARLADGHPPAGGKAWTKL